MGDIDTFLETIFGDQVGNTPIGLIGSKGQLNDFRWFKWPEQRAAMVAHAEAHTKQDLYYSPILFGDMKSEDKSGRKVISRTPENALTTQVVYLDSDTAKPSDFRLDPSIVVTTSTGRYHPYWMLAEPVAASVASEVAHRMTTAHAEQGSDPNAWSANKILRIPGSINSKWGFPEAVTVQYSGEIYNLDDLSGAYDDIEVINRSPMRAERVAITTPDDLPDYGDTLEKLSQKTLELALSEPHEDQDRSRLRYKLLLDLFRDGLSFDEVLSIAWHSPAARKWSQEDSRGIAGLTAEASKAEAEYEQEAPVSSDTPWEMVQSDDIPTDEPVVEAKLLKDEERSAIAGGLTFIDRYIHEAGLRVPKQNTPYDRMNAWIVLSGAFAATGFIPRRNGPEPLNMYCIELGDTTTGKSAARKFKLGVLHEFYKTDPEFNLGGNPSPNGLSRKLVERDGRVSYYNKDEAHGSLKLWAGPDGAGWTTGLLEDFADIYDGKVTGSLRAKAEEGEGKTAETFFLMDLMGTPKAMVAALHRDLFLSGFLARFQWAIGEPREVSYDSMMEEDAEFDSVRIGFDPVARDFAVELRDIQREVIDGGPSRVGIVITRKAAKRLQDAKWQLNQMFEKDRNWEILEPSLVRMGVTIRKAASLIAMSEGLTTVSERHILIGLQAAEEWVTNLVIVAAQISASDFQRETDAIEELIVSRGGSMRREAVMRHFKAVDTRTMAGYLDSLAQQGRVREINDDKRVKWLEAKLKKEEKE